MTFAFPNIARVTFPAVALVALTACGGGSSPPPSVGGTGTGGTDYGGTGSNSPPPPPFIGYTVGGTVSGLVGQGLVLKLVGLNYVHPQSLDQLPISSKGNFEFKTTIGSNGPNASVAGFDYPGIWSYQVSIAQQPHSPTQRCAVSTRYSSFAIASNVADVGVVCGEFSYSTNAVDNTISAFSVDAFTGALVSVSPPVAAGLSPIAIASTSDKKYLYVANSGSNDVSAFAVDPNNGNLTTIPGSPFAAGTNPRALALSTYFDESYLYVANAGSDDLSAYQVDQRTGVLTPLSPASYATGTNPSAMFMVPGQYGYGGNWPVLLTANSGSNNISAFEVIRASGLRPKEGSPFPSDTSNVSSLAIAGGFLYAANANGGTATISGFSLAPPAGLVVPGTIALTPLAGLPYVLPSCTFIVADGMHLYATSGTNVFGYSVDAQTGALSPLPGFPVAVGANADSLSLDPTSQFLYVRNASAGTVTGFKLDGATGALTAMPGSPFAVGKSADFIATF